MDKIQTTKLLLMLNILYPNFRTDESQLDLKIELWHELLGHESFDLIAMAVKKLSYENTYPPTIADVAKRISEIKNPNISTDAEAWGEVKKAISNFGYYDEMGALASLSETTRKVVESMGFREICTSENIDTVRAQFRMAYNSIATRKRQDDLLPDGLKQQMAQIGNIKRLEGEK